MRADQNSLHACQRSTEDPEPRSEPANGHLLADLPDTSSPPGFFAGCHARFQIIPQTKNSWFEVPMLVVQYSTVLYSSYSRIRTASTVIQ